MHLTVRADDPPKESDDDKADTSLKNLITNPIIATLLLCPVLMAAGFTFLDPVLGPHLSAQGYSAGMVGAAFGVVSAVYACLSPATGWVFPALLLSLPGPVLGRHLNTQGLFEDMVGAAFGVVSAVYACLFPANGWDPPPPPPTFVSLLPPFSQSLSLSLFLSLP